MAFFLYEGRGGDEAPNGVFNFRGVNFEVDGVAKELTDPEAISKARAMSGTLRETAAPGALGDDLEAASEKAKGKRSK